MPDLSLEHVPESDLWAELERRGAAIKVGWCYPARCADDDATALVREHGYELGPFALIERDHPRLAGPPHWPVIAQVPLEFQRGIDRG